MRTELYAAAPLVPEAWSVGWRLLLENLKIYKFWIINGIPAELIQVRVKTLHTGVHELTTYIYSKVEFSWFVKIPMEHYSDQ
jgi:hypothetical protein